MGLNLSSTVYRMEGMLNKASNSCPPNSQENVTWQALGIIACQKLKNELGNPWQRKN